MTSPSLLDRFTSPRRRSPILPFHNASDRSSTEYDLDVLEPRPDDAFRNEVPSRSSFGRPARAPETRQLSPSFRDSRAESFGSPPGSRRKPMFAGPPPPIASSVYIQSPLTNRSVVSSSRATPPDQGLISGSTLNLGPSFFDQRSKELNNQQDSHWRGLKRRERALERELQKLLDVQASGLLEDGTPSSEKDFETASDGDASSGFSTFYSTATSKSRMMNSLHVPTRSTPDGNVIPVRQPLPKKPPSLRSARAGLRRTMAALSDLKAEEDTYVDDALLQRKDALVHLKKMSSRRDKIYAELHNLEDDEEEPLGQELRELSAEQDKLSRDIRLLEEKLVGMRNRRRWVREKIEDVKSRREAGLSGYKAAGRDIDTEIETLMRRPPVIPLDLDALRQGEHGDAGAEEDSPGGVEFLKLRPERRTPEMAKMWWEGEVALLNRRKAQIQADREALDEGLEAWSDVTKLVADYESSLRAFLKTQLKHNGQMTLQQDAIRSQVQKMDSVVSKLEARLSEAEEKHWNLLICAIGAELEAFLKARTLLLATFDESDKEEDDTTPIAADMDRADEDGKDGHADDASNGHAPQHDESDNEVPPDLLVSHLEEHEHDEPESPQRSVVLRRMESANEVPPEFLVEHSEDVE